jgi:hypothetical protein
MVAGRIRPGKTCDAPRSRSGRRGIKFAWQWGMDEQTIADHLALAERHVTEGRAHVAKQRGLIEKLRGGGHDTAQAEALLVEFESALHLQIEQRDRLIEELRERPP